MKFNSIDIVNSPIILNITDYELIHFYSDRYRMHQFIIKKIQNKIKTEETRSFRSLLNSVDSEWN